MLLRRIAVIVLTGIALGVPPASADSISDGTMVAMTMVGGGGLVALGCGLLAINTRPEEEDDAAFDRQGFYVGLSGSNAFENFDESDVQDFVGSLGRSELRSVRGNPDYNNTPTNPNDDDPGNYVFNLDDLESGSIGLGVSGHLGYRCHPWVAAELQFEVVDDFHAQTSEAPSTLVPSVFPPVTGPIDVKFEPLVFTTNVKAHLLQGRFQPFVLVGPGFMRLETKTREQTNTMPNASDTIVKYATRFGGGIDIYATENVVVSLDASYLMPTGKLAGFDYISIGWGLQYRF